MTYTFVIRPDAEADLAEAKRWYEERREGLGADFVLCVEEALEKVRRNPEVYPIIYKNVRRATVRRFPYGVFYRVVVRQIIVLGVFHGRRDPRSWQARA
jgi:plasmid stabilization system protein ParE